jgi:hypothetical protein
MHEYSARCRHFSTSARDHQAGAELREHAPVVIDQAFTETLEVLQMQVAAQVAQRRLLQRVSRAGKSKLRSSAETFGRNSVTSMRPPAVAVALSGASRKSALAKAAADQAIRDRNSEQRTSASLAFSSARLGF